MSERPEDHERPSHPLPHTFRRPAHRRGWCPAKRTPIPGEGAVQAVVDSDGGDRYGHFDGPLLAPDARIQRPTLHNACVVGSTYRVIARGCIQHAPAGESLVHGRSIRSGTGEGPVLSDRARRPRPAGTEDVAYPCWRRSPIEPDAAALFSRPGDYAEPGAETKCRDCSGGGAIRQSSDSTGSGTHPPTDQSIILAKSTDVVETRLKTTYSSNCR